jgi:hypothetical protein
MIFKQQAQRPTRCLKIPTMIEKNGQNNKITKNDHFTQTLI